MKTILIIEDSSDIRENTCELLELEGYKAISAPNGKAGIALTRQAKPDIILCDIMMPEANGYEVFNAIKNDDETAHIPFIFLTASVQKKEIEAGLKMGAKGYIKKPFELSELLEVLQSVMNNE